MFFQTGIRDKHVQLSIKHNLLQPLRSSIERWINGSDTDSRSLFKHISSFDQANSPRSYPRYHTGRVNKNMPRKGRHCTCKFMGVNSRVTYYIYKHIHMGFLDEPKILRNKKNRSSHAMRAVRSAPLPDRTDRLFSTTTRQCQISRQQPSACNVLQLNSFLTLYHRG